MKNKLKLNYLKVQSFITLLDEEQAQKALAGQASLVCVPTDNRTVCQTRLQSCISGCVTCPECPPPY